MLRREFIAAVGGAAVWPSVAARAQQSVRRVGVLTFDTGVRTFEGVTQTAKLLRDELRNLGLD